MHAPEPNLRRPVVYQGVSIDESTDDYVFGTFENVMLYAWRRHTTPHSLDVAAAACDRARDLGPSGKHAIFGVAEESAVVPGRDMRTAMSHLINSRVGMLCASAFAFEGTGFRAATIRSVGIGLSILSRGLVPHRVFGTKRAGAEWIREEMQREGADCPDAESLLRAMESLRRCPVSRLSSL